MISKKKPKSKKISSEEVATWSYWLRGNLDTVFPIKRKKKKL